MPRKAYKDDLAVITASPPQGIEAVVEDGDGEFDFAFALGPKQTKVVVHAMIPEQSDYPSNHMFFLSTATSGLPQLVASTLADLTGFTTGMKVQELMINTASKLQDIMNMGDSAHQPITVNDYEDVSMRDWSTPPSSDSEAEDDWPEDPDLSFDSEHLISMDNKTARLLEKRIRQDLRLVKEAGFRVGIVHGLKAESSNNILSIAIQVNRLDLSEEVLQAWNLQVQQYVVLLISYRGTYKTFENVVGEAATNLDIRFKLGVCDKYKPTMSEATAALSDAKRIENNDTNSQAQRPSVLNETVGTNFRDLFISSSLNQLLKDQYISLLKVRAKSTTGIDWDGAQQFLHDRQGMSGIAPEPDMESCYSTARVTKNSTKRTSILEADHVTDVGQLSFPLISMQFAMRRLVRCTKYCLVCHSPVEDEFEALKPYVCSEALCLYQYMALGYGPTIEHEIVTQPNVVDLLISFCYSSVATGNLREYPTGLAFKVPHGFYTPVVPPAQSSHLYNMSNATKVESQKLLREPFTMPIKFDASKNEITFLDTKEECPVKPGDWVMFRNLDKHSDSTPFHGRIKETSLYPTVTISEVIRPGPNPGTALTNILPDPSTVPKVILDEPTPPAVIDAQLQVYYEDFNTLDQNSMARSIVLLLDLLPSVQEMRSYIINQRNQDKSLQTWSQRLSPACLGILRWVIASNRSCIVQVDTLPGQTKSDAEQTGVRLDQKIPGMDDWVQFRFAQGSPDKEHRFSKALRDAQKRLDLKHPTIFAWHGSDLKNWHSIIRTGLDFNKTVNGRAFGHGCYHSQDMNVSMGYSRNIQPGILWTKSTLMVQTALCLNEIINAPKEYVNCSPHLVIQHVDWIQCRYLFVKVTVSSSPNTVNPQPLVPISSDSQIAVEEIEQDPKFPVKDYNGRPLRIPLAAIPSSRRSNASVPPTPRKTKSSVTSSNNPKKSDSHKILEEDTDNEDVHFLLSDSEVECPVWEDRTPTKEENRAYETQRESKRLKTTEFSYRPAFPNTPSHYVLDESKTDFRPDTLDQRSLVLIEPPSSATPQATRTLIRELKSVREAQAKTPQHELGWYLDPNLISNVFQWIVELHSFDPGLPLAKDMKAQSVTSIVLELRFSTNYPFSPPFVRVIRPRFLPFTQGGGGHVTGGGAMCMELLTSSGWSAVSSIESVLLQVRLAMANLEPKPARLVKGNFRDYTVSEAMEAFKRACMQHGWEMPKDFQQLSLTW